MPWSPILEGALAEKALLAIRHIAKATAAEPAADPADRTLFWAYATNLIDEPWAHTAYAAAFDDVLASLREGVGSAALHGGLAGIGFTLAHVLEGGGEDVLTVIDEALLGALAEDDSAIDLADGAVGLGVYFVERLRTNANASLAEIGLDRVVQLLERTAIHTKDGATWLASNGYHDLGVAHGVPGVIGFLSRARGVVRSCKMRGLCEDASRWLRAQDQTDGFPTLVAPPAPEQWDRFSRLGTDPGFRASPRVAWCYGDPGIAAATWTAAPDLARTAALRSANHVGGARIASLADGAAGLAHLCNRFYQATGDVTHAVAARTWYSRALHLETRSPGVVDGSIGVALALIAAISTEAPAWDRLLLADLEVAS